MFSKTTTFMNKKEGQMDKIEICFKLTLPKALNDFFLTFVQQW